MYFPYLRGKQFDYGAVREANPRIYASGKVLPIIEPISTNVTAFRDLAQKGIGFILIVNPLVGDARPVEIVRRINNELNTHPSLILGFNITGSTRVTELNNFFDSFPDHRKALIFHGENERAEIIRIIAANKTDIDWVIFIDGQVSTAFIGRFSRYQRVLINDSFKKVARNADYPNSSHFSGLYNTYRGDGFQGFGDFLILPYDYAKGGGPAHAVTLHLTQASRGAIKCNHFVSDDTVGSANTGGKYEQARVKLTNFLDANPRVDVTTGSASFRSTSFPGLGVAKKRSLIHHMELIASLI